MESGTNGSQEKKLSHPDFDLDSAKNEMTKIKADAMRSAEFTADMEKEDNADQKLDFLKNENDKLVKMIENLPDDEESENEVYNTIFPEQKSLSRDFWSKLENFISK